MTQASRLTRCVFLVKLAFPQSSEAYITVKEGNRALVIVLWSRQFSRLRNSLEISVSEASRLVSTKPITKALLPPSRYYLISVGVLKYVGSISRT